jgi:hypothetical protein
MAISADRPDARKNVVWQHQYTRSFPAREGAGSSFRALTLKLLAVTVLVTCFSGAPVSAMGRAGQTPSKQETVTEPASQVSPPVNASIKDILTGSVKFNTTEVMVKGIFKGWKGECPSSSPITRSDWVLEDDTGCIYITGRIPTALSPLQPKGERVLVKGRVIITKKGTPVIKASGITLLSK